MKTRLTKHWGAILRGRRPVGHGRHWPLGRGRWRLLAAIVPAALAAVTLFPAAASADYTRGFHIYNFSRSPLQLGAIIGGQFDGTPPIGSVLQPGQGYDDYEMVWNFGANNTSDISYSVDGRTVDYAVALKVAGFGDPSSACYAKYGQCSAGGTNITFYDAPGTVIDIPAGQGQQQAAALNQFCNDTTAATCKFTATSEAPAWSPSHPVGRRLVNESSEDQDTMVTIEDKVGTTDSVEVGVKVGAKIKGLVEVEVEAKYGHEWIQEHTFSQDVTVHCPAHHTCWIEGVDPMLRNTGDFTMTLGNTTWHLHGVYFDSPDPNGQGAFVVKDCEIGTSGCPSTSEKLGATKKPIVLSGTYTPPRKAAIVKPDLRLKIAGPSTLTAGKTASYRITVSSSEPDNRYVYALTDVRVRSSDAGHPARDWLLRGLAEEKARTLQLEVGVPKSAHVRFCVNVSAAARHANGAHARKCVPVAG